MSVKVRELKPGVFGLKIDNKGKRKQITIGTKAAAKKAKIKLEIKIAESKLGLLDKPTAPTFSKVAEGWLDFILVGRSTATYTRYKGILDKHLSKPLGKLQIDKTTRGDIRDTLLSIYKAGASRASIELMHTVCSGVFMYARDDELIDTIPTQGILRRLDLRKDSKEITPFTADQMDRLLDTIDYRYYVFFVTAFQTACRVGELCALQWQDINFNDSLIRINKTAKDQKIKQSTKTYMARDVDMSEKLFGILINLKAEDKKICFKLGIEQNFVFHKKGKLLSQNVLRRKLSLACKKLGIGHHVIHDIRHTTASLLLSRGTPLLYVSQLLGHSSPKITLDRYSHYMPSENKGLINTLDRSKNLVYKDNAK